jgi:hypothetical protein
VVREEEKRAKALSGRSSSGSGGGGGYHRETPFSWAGPAESQEKIARRKAELGNGMPIPDSKLKAGTVVGVGRGGLEDTYAVEYDDGSLEVTPCVVCVD